MARPAKKTARTNTTRGRLPKSPSSVGWYCQEIGSTVLEDLSGFLRRKDVAGSDAATLREGWRQYFDGNQYVTLYNPLKKRINDFHDLKGKMTRWEVWDSMPFKLRLNMDAYLQRDLSRIDPDVHGYFTIAEHKQQLISQMTIAMQAPRSLSYGDTAPGFAPGTTDSRGLRWVQPAVPSSGGLVMTHRLTVVTPSERSSTHTQPYTGLSGPPTMVASGDNAFIVEGLDIIRENDPISPCKTYPPTSQDLALGLGGSFSPAGHWYPQDSLDHRTANTYVRYTAPFAFADTQNSDWAVPNPVNYDIGVQYAHPSDTFTQWGYSSSGSDYLGQYTEPARQPSGRRPLDLVKMTW